VAERLLRPRDIDADGLLLIDPAAPAAAVGALTLRWCATDLEGHRSAVSASAAQPNPRKDGYVVPLELTAMDDIPAEVVAMGLVLPCWTLLGMMDRAIELTRSYILERKQFGQPIAAFQGVQFQLTEAEVDRLGLHELAKYSLWSVETRQPHAVTDALALRAAALDAAALVFRVAHQLHGAIGFCDETPLSWVSRASVPLRRYPFTAGTARAALVDRIDTEGLVGPFSC
jgi:alkylation response protein AidB-like acyl-CoA dehydrogenase